MRFWCVFSFCAGAVFMGLIWTIVEGDWVTRGLAIFTLLGLGLYVLGLVALVTDAPIRSGPASYGGTVSQGAANHPSSRPNPGAAK